MDKDRPCHKLVKRKYCVFGQDQSLIKGTNIKKRLQHASINCVISLSFLNSTFPTSQDFLDPSTHLGLQTSFHLVFAGPSLAQHKFWVFNITLLGPASQLVFVYYITIAAMPSLLCRLQILVGWELEQFSDRKSCVTQQVSVTGNARIFMKYH